MQVLALAMLAAGGAAALDATAPEGGLHALASGRQSVLGDHDADRRADALGEDR
jgi:hypothetical protein